MNKEIKDIVNFRDLGGIPAAGGKCVAPARLLRCAELSNISRETSLYLQEVYQVKNIVDFRSEAERKHAPDHEVTGACYRTLNFFPDMDATGENSIVKGNQQQLSKIQSHEQVYAKMKELYASFVTGAAPRAALREFLLILQNTEEGATLFHCTAGKDRTGVSAAVILHILGVGREEIMKDYLATNAMRREANHRTLEKMRSQGAAEEMLKIVETALCVEKEYLEIFFAAAEQEYGSFDRFITEGLKVGDEEQEKLREMYLN